MAHIMTKLGMCLEKMKMQTGFCFFFSFYQIPLVLGPTPGTAQARGTDWRRGLPTWPRDTAVGSGWSCLLSSRSPFLPHGGRWGSAHVCLMPVLAGGGCRGCGAPEEGQEGPSQLWPESCPLSRASQGDRVSGRRLARCLASCGFSLAPAGRPLRGWRPREPNSHSIIDG